MSVSALISFLNWLYLLAICPILLSSINSFKLFAALLYPVTACFNKDSLNAPLDAPTVFKFLSKLMTNLYCPSSSLCFATSFFALSFNSPSFNLFSASFTRAAMFIFSRYSYNSLNLAAQAD